MDTPGLKILEKMFVEHYQEWCLMSFSYVGNLDDAKDVVQHVFVNLLQKESIAYIDEIKRYVHTSVRNESLKKIRQNKRTFEIYNQPTETPSFEREWIEGEISKSMFQELEALPEQNKRAFTLCVLEGIKYARAAEIMGITVNTVKYHLKKSFKILRLNLKDVYLWFL